MLDNHWPCFCAWIAEHKSIIVFYEWHQVDLQLCVFVRSLFSSTNNDDPVLCSHMSPSRAFWARDLGSGGAPMRSRGYAVPPVSGRQTADGGSRGPWFSKAFSKCHLSNPYAPPKKCASSTARQLWKLRPRYVVTFLSAIQTDTLKYAPDVHPKWAAEN